MPTSNPPNAGKPDPRPRSFLGIRIVFKDSQCMDYGLPKEIRKYIQKAENDGGLNYDDYLELVDHFRAGLADGRTPQDLINGLGDPKTLSASFAKVHRRKTRVLIARTTRLIPWLFFACILVYAGMWFYLRWATPNPTIDFYAILNKRTLDTPVDSHAWPIYLPVIAHQQFRSDAMSNALEDQSFDYPHYYLKPGDARWPIAQRYLTEIAPLLAQVRIAAQKPHLGLTLSAWPSQDVLRARQEGSQKPLPSPPVVADHSASRLAAGMFQEGNIVEFGLIAYTGYPLIADMYFAAEQNQPDRVYEDFQTLLAMSRQIRQVPLETARFRAQHLTGRAIQTIAQISLAAPGLLSEAQLASIRLQARSEIDAISIFVPLEPNLHDKIQRIYTNDNGDGRITRDGAIFLCSGMPGLRDDIITKPPSWPLVIQAELSLPILYLLLPSQSQATKEHDLLIATSQLSGLAPWRAGPHPGLAEIDAEKLGFIRFMIRFFIHEQVHVGLTHTLLRSARREFQVNDALLAIAQYRAHHNHWPQTPSDLVPAFLPQLPTGIDPDEALVMKQTPQGISVYSLGPNGIDDGGLYSAKAQDWHHGSSASIPAGDIVYFPAGGRRPALPANLPPLPGSQTQPR